MPQLQSPRGVLPRTRALWRGPPRVRRESSPASQMNLKVEPESLSGLSCAFGPEGRRKPMCVGTAQAWLFQTWLFAIFYAEAFFCALSRSFAPFCTLSRSFACFCVRPRLERPRFGNCRVWERGIRLYPCSTRCYARGFVLFFFSHSRINIEILTITSPSFLCSICNSLHLRLCKTTYSGCSGGRKRLRLRHTYTYIFISQEYDM